MFKIRFTKDYPKGKRKVGDEIKIDSKRVPAHLKDYAEMIDGESETQTKKRKKKSEE